MMVGIEKTRKLKKVKKNKIFYFISIILFVRIINYYYDFKFKWNYFKRSYIIKSLIMNWVRLKCHLYSSNINLN